MKRTGFLLYGVVAYTFFLWAMLYAMGFVGNLRIPIAGGLVFVPKSMDVPGGVGASALEAILVDLALVAVFALQHSVMARRGFKSWWTKFVPRPIERSTYVLAASAALALLMWQWRPIGAPVWRIEDPTVTKILGAVCVLGWFIASIATFHIDHFSLFGLRQVYDVFRGSERAPAPSQFTTPGLYRLVRHPIYLGFILAFWSTPVMSVGHLVFAIATTVYILLGIRLEEKDLVDELGQEYEGYRSRVPMLMPGVKLPPSVVRKT
jgi:protein-S-isoprenylcysteine O-methyltransferase Ste14